MKFNFTHGTKIDVGLPGFFHLLNTVINQLFSRLEDNLSGNKKITQWQDEYPIPGFTEMAGMVEKYLLNHIEKRTDKNGL